METAPRAPQPSSKISADISAASQTPFKWIDQ